MTTATGDTLNYTYDALKRLNNVTTKNASGTALFSTSYAFKNLSTTSGITQTTTQVQYRNVRIGTNGTILEGKKYSYDDVGNITKISQSTSPYNPLVAYEYDSQNQLISEIYYDGEGSADTNITQAYYYTYDTAGNLLTVEEGTVNSDGTITKTTIQTYTYGTGDWKDLLTAVNGNTIIYEGQTYNESTGEIEGAATGNPTSYPVNGTSYDLTWQNGRQLSSFSKVNTALPSGRWTVSYKYDTDGIRTEKRVPRGNRGLYTVYTYITQNGKIMRQSDNRGIAAQVLDFVYDESGKPFALNYSTNNGSSFTTYYYILNLQGDVVGLTDASGTFVAQYTYNAWGEVLTATGSMAAVNPLRYRGYYYDFETGFYYLQSRYYDPANHRFINADNYASTGQGFAGTNMFAYCGNNPVSRIDSTGQFWNEIWEFVQNVVLEVGNAIKEFIPQYVGCGALALLDGPVPVLDVFAIAGAAIITVGAIGYGVYRAIQTPAKSTLKAEEKAEEAVIPQETNNPVVFPVNPDYFNPLGLVKVYRAGTKNGSFISWMNPLTHSEVFRWDENPNYPNGPHYHIYGMGHYVPGMDIVPEPYASIYFPTR